jgi:aspartyl-tRNA(Asn)/glutamyl-tRNA(Gln) amidotransferase subunit C
MLATMSVTREEVEHIARLARVRLSPDEIERLSRQLSGILDHFAALSAVDTDGVEPTAHPLPLANVMRADSVAPSLPRDDVLANAVATEDGYIRVRAVLE